MLKHLLKILNTNTFLLDSKERVIQGVLLFLIMSIFSLLILSFICMSSPKLFFPLLISFELLIFFIGLDISLHSIYGKFFNMLSSTDPISLSYEGVIVNLLCLSIGAFSFWLGIAFFIGPFWPFFSFALAWLLPPWIMFFRKDVFKENSIPISTNLDNVIGYSPIWFYLFGSISLFVPFFLLLKILFFSNNNLLAGGFIIFILIETILIFCPDFWDKILPFEIRTKKGTLIYFSLVILIVSFISIVFYEII